MYKYVTLFDREGSLWARWSRDDYATPPLFWEPLSRPPRSNARFCAPQSAHT